MTYSWHEKHPPMFHDPTVPFLKHLHHCQVVLTLLSPMTTYRCRTALALLMPMYFSFIGLSTFMIGNFYWSIFVSPTKTPCVAHQSPVSVDDMNEWVRRNCPNLLYHLISVFSYEVFIISWTVCCFNISESAHSKKKYVFHWANTSWIDQLLKQFIPNYQMSGNGVSLQ